MKKILFIAMFIFTLLLGAQTSFSWTYTHAPGQMRMEGFPGIAYQTADILEYNLTHDIDRIQPVFFSSFVDINDLATTSIFGRMLGEQVGSRFSQHGYNVIEVKLREDPLFMDIQKGEFALSRDIEEIKEPWDAQAVIAGTYSIIDDMVMVSARIVSTADNSILSSHEFSIKMDEYLSQMISPDRITTAVEEKETQQDEITHRGPLSTGAIQLSTSRSTDAKLIQKRLADLGLYKDRIDGIWGKNSKAALEEFKNQHQMADPQKWDMPAQIHLFQETNQ